MTLGEKITKLRKEENYTQEQLAQILNVSRQSVSKWESDLAYPETDKLLRMGRLFNCSMDYLMKEECTDRSGVKAVPTCIDFTEEVEKLSKKVFRERKSEKKIFGMPLYHVGRDARGFFAVGLRARGVFSLGLFSVGIVSVGLLSIGLFAAGTLALGLLVLGSIAVGLVSVGAISVGIVAIGALAMGQFAVGGLAMGNYIAIGDNARAMIALGHTEAVGSLYQASMPVEGIGKIQKLLDSCVPGYLGWANAIMKLLLMYI